MPTPTQPTPPATDPSQRPGVDPGSPEPEHETVTIPGAGEVELVPPGHAAQVQPDGDGKSRPIVVVPDIQEDVGPGHAPNHPR